VRRLAIGLAIAVGALLLAIGVSVALIESEEVVVIYTRDPNGRTHAARVWVVDHSNLQWVAPGNRSNGWFQRLLVDPRVELVRSGARGCYLASVVEGSASLPVLRQFLEKYQTVIRATALLNRILEPGGDSSPPVAVRLDPC
jgi:hypothetical protein